MDENSDSSSDYNFNGEIAYAPISFILLFFSFDFSLPLNAISSFLQR